MKYKTFPAQPHLTVSAFRVWSCVGPSRTEQRPSAGMCFCVYMYILCSASYRKTSAFLLWLSSPTTYSPTHDPSLGFLPAWHTVHSNRSRYRRGLLGAMVSARGRRYVPPTTSAHRGQSVSEDSAVYFQQRGHFSLVVGVTITLYEDSSRISPPVSEKHTCICRRWFKLSPSCLGRAGHITDVTSHTQQDGGTTRQQGAEEAKARRDALIAQTEFYAWLRRAGPPARDLAQLSWVWSWKGSVAQEFWKEPNYRTTAVPPLKTSWFVHKEIRLSPLLTLFDLRMVTW